MGTYRYKVQKAGGNKKGPQCGRCFPIVIASLMAPLLTPLQLQICAWSGRSNTLSTGAPVELPKSKSARRLDTAVADMNICINTPAVSELTGRAPQSVRDFLTTHRAALTKR